MTPSIPFGEQLEDTYARWWDPPVAHRPWYARVPTTPRPHCGTWYGTTAPIPATARWAVVHVVRPGRVRYARSRDAGAAMVEGIALADHPHVYLVPVTVTAPQALVTLLRRHGLAQE